MIVLAPITRDKANAFVTLNHRHHKAVRSHRFAVSVSVDGAMVGVVIVASPVAWPLDDGKTFEVVRLCVRSGCQNVSSRLLGASWRASKAMGVVRLVSYTRADESGSCYLAAGWRPVARVRGRDWTTGNKAQRWLPGLYVPSTETVDRVRWEIARP